MDTPLKIDISNEIQSTLAALTESAKDDLKAEMFKICGSEEGTLTFSTVMKNKANRAAERLLLTFISEAVEQVSAISASSQAYLLIHNSVSAAFLDLEETVASGGFLPPSPSVTESIARDFDRIRERVLPSLELHQSKFAKPKNQGGRPEEWTWGEVNAFVLQQFPDGLPRIKGTKTAIRNLMELYFKDQGLFPPSPRHLLRKAGQLYNKYHEIR